MKKLTMPMVALRGLVGYPYMVLNFEVAREISILAMEAAMLHDQMVFLVAQKDMRVEQPEEGDIYKVGTVARVRHIIRLPGDAIRVLVEGCHRAQLQECHMDEYFTADVVKCEEEFEDEDRAKAYKRELLETFEEYAKTSGKISAETLVAYWDIRSASKLADTVAVNVLQNLQEKQDVLELFELEARFEKIIEYTRKEIKLNELQNEISTRTRLQIEKIQKEHYLREQMKAIQNTLSDGDDSEPDIVEEFRQKLETLPVDEKSKTKIGKEISKLERLSPHVPDYNVSLTYLETVFDMPWNEYTQDNLDLENARKVLDDEHYGLEKVKERILQYLAVRKLKNDMKGPIICFAGPPGVGKTSIAKSIAHALEREFVRMSLGGVRDEAEIRGHRKTYIGAIPGRIIASMKTAGTMNPVFLLDEIDKLTSDMRGDPSAAMLEVLDPMINNSFVDHYMEIGFDLSNVLFVTTANDVDMIPAPLYDRMEVIDISSYTAYEKEQIALRHLIPKQKEEHGIKKSALMFEPSAVENIISGYTSESGVRGLERQIAKVCRQAAIKFVEGKKNLKITKNNLKKYLGVPRYTDTRLPKEPKVGVAIGLAWTSVGGVTMPIEISIMEGTGNTELTGQLGDVMKESAKTGISLVRVMAKELGVDEEFHKDKDIHIHIPEGAVPKDGPSAGITMTLALVSALTGRRVRHDIAMTGEITLTGRVLAIGGLKEKSLAALRGGVTDIMIPADNKKDLEEIPKEILDKLKFYPVENISQVLKLGLAD